MTKETILKRLLLENHITVEELVILGAMDFYQTRDPHSFPPIMYGPSMPGVAILEESLRHFNPIKKVASLQENPITSKL